MFAIIDTWGYNNIMHVTDVFFYFFLKLSKIKYNC